MKIIDHISTLLTWCVGALFLEAVRKSLSAIMVRLLPSIFCCHPRKNTEKCVIPGIEK